MKCSTENCGRDVFSKGMCQRCYQKHRFATNPEARKSHSASTKKWRMGNIENYLHVLELNRGYAAKKQIVKKVRQLEASRMLSITNKIGLNKDVARHLAKGRSIADICILTNQKMSMIQQVIQSLQPTAQP